MNKKIYELIKSISQEKSQPLKIVCDWDEVIQNHFSMIVWELSGEKEKGTKFEEFYESYWLKEGGYEGWADFADKYQIYFGDGKAKYKQARVNTIADTNPPLISLADEVLLCLKEGLIQEITFLSGYNQKEPEHEKQKNDIFQATFGQFPAEQARMVTVPLDSVTQKAEKFPHDVSSYLLDQRTLLIIREGIMVSIEKELVQLGFEENLTLAKRNLEKRLLYEHSQSLEIILDSKVTDILVAWDFHKDKSTILLILNPTS